MNWMTSSRVLTRWLVALTALLLFERVAHAESPPVAITAQTEAPGASAQQVEPASSPALEDLASGRAMMIEAGWPIQLTTSSAGPSLARIRVCHISHHKAILERTCPLVFADATGPMDLLPLGGILSRKPDA